MIEYDKDPDVVRWGLDSLIGVCTLSNSGSSRSITVYDLDTSNVEYVTEGYNEVVNSNIVENDAIIACALQEELSKVADAEASGHHNPGQEPILTQDWFGPTDKCYFSEHQNDQKTADDYSKNTIDFDDYHKNEGDDYSEKRNEESEASVSFSSFTNGEGFCTEGLSYFLDIADEHALDGEVGKRLNQMIPVPHVPKINGEIPSEDDEISDHQRLLDRLKVYDLVENKVQGDGNCQFRALSDQLYRSSDHHTFVRQEVVNQLESHPQMYEGYVPMPYGDYLKKMSMNGEWGDHVTLQAAADVYGIKIFVITSFKDTCYIEILPHIPRSKRVIFLSFWAEVHYNSIYPEGEVPLTDTKKKKWWMLGL